MGTRQILLVLIVAAHHTAGDIAASRNVIFYSTNFHNILQWNSVGGEHYSDTVYDVQYRKYGEAWINKNECLKITDEFCDLTNETKEVAEPYVARVLAASRNGTSYWNITTGRFIPRRETNLGAPGVSYTAGVRSVRFLIQPPLTPFKSEDGSPLSIEDIYSDFSLVYHMVMSSQGAEHMKWEWKISTKDIEIPMLFPATEYCGDISIEVTLLGKKSERKPFCVKTLPEKDWLFILFVGLVFCIGLITAALFHTILKYVKKQGRMPKSLQNILLQGFTGASSEDPPVDYIVSNEISRGNMIFSSVSPNKISRADPIFKPVPQKLLTIQQSDQPQSSPILAMSSSYAPQVSPSSCLASMEATGYASQRNGLQTLPSVTANLRLDTSTGNSHFKCNPQVAYGILVGCTHRQGGYAPQSNKCFGNVSAEGIQIINCKLKYRDAHEENLREQYHQESLETLKGTKEHKDLCSIQLAQMSEDTLEAFASSNDEPAGQLVLETEWKNGKLQLPLLFSLLTDEEQAEDTLSQLANGAGQPEETLSLLSSVKVNDVSLSEDDMQEEHLQLSTPLFVLCACDENALDDSFSSLGNAESRTISLQFENEEKNPYIAEWSNRQICGQQHMEVV